MKRITAYLLVLLAIVLFPIQCTAGERVFNAPRYPSRLLKLQFASSANVFTTVDPSPAGTPLTETSATGISNMDGSASLAFEGGFTPPITVTVYYWQRDQVTASNSCWVRLGWASALYASAVDTNYALLTFVLPENTPFLVMTSAAVTGNVYTDARPDALNNNSATGFN